jgi:hypothetical protein
MGDPQPPSLPLTPLPKVAARDEGVNGGRSAGHGVADDASPGNPALAGAVARRNRAAAPGEGHHSCRCGEGAGPGPLAPGGRPQVAGCVAACNGVHGQYLWI